MKIGFYGSCQLHLASPVFINSKILNNNKIEVIFSLPFYVYDKLFPGYIGELDYSIFNNLDILIIENNNLDCKASSNNIINYCKNKNIKIFKTCLIKFPIYPINWSGYCENIKDYKDWIGLDNIDYKLKFEKCLISLSNNIAKSDLNKNIIDFIKNNFNKQLLFTHSLHPTNILL